jgi:hypothetical protein
MLYIYECQSNVLSHEALHNKQYLIRRQYLETYELPNKRHTVSERIGGCAKKKKIIIII